MVTGRPSMILNSATKSSRWKGSSLASAVRRPASSFAMIIWRTAPMRAGSKNICSVRHRPMPSAPNLRAVSASSGVSAFGAHFQAPRRIGPAHQRAELAGELRLDHLHRAREHFAGRAVDA